MPKPQKCRRDQADTGIKSDRETASIRCNDIAEPEAHRSARTAGWPPRAVHAAHPSPDADWQEGRI